MKSEDREKMFEEYLTSSYQQANILDESQFIKASEGFEQMYQGYLPEDKSAKILEVGCGCGHFLYFLKKKGYENYQGMDISPQLVDYCKEHITKNIVQADIFDFLRNKEGVYDCIVAHDVQEHIPKEQMLDFLKLIFVSLKDEGIFISRVPNMSNPFSLDSRYSDFTHEVGFTEKSLYQMLWLGGFRTMEVLPPRKIQVQSFRNFSRKILLGCLHQFLRFCYYIQDFTVPSNLDKNLVVVSKKTQSKEN